jgi:hypothetical protein
MSYPDEVAKRAVALLRDIGRASYAGPGGCEGVIERALLEAFEAGRRSVLGDPINGNDEDDEKPRG